MEHAAPTDLLSLNELSGKQEAVAGTIPYSDSPNDVQGFIDDSNVRKKEELRILMDARMQAQMLSVKRAANSLRRISVAPLNCL